MCIAGSVELSLFFFFYLAWHWIGSKRAGSYRQGEASSSSIVPRRPPRLGKVISWCCGRGWVGPKQCRVGGQSGHDTPELASNQATLDLLFSHNRIISCW